MFSKWVEFMIVFLTCEARRTASLWRKRVKWLVRLKLPVNHFPGGTKSWDPPHDEYWLRWLMAAWKAPVFDAVPSPTPPKSVNDAPWALQLMAEYLKWSVTFAFRPSTPLLFVLSKTRIASSTNISDISEDEKGKTKKYIKKEKRKENQTQRWEGKQFS